MRVLLIEDKGVSQLSLGSTIKELGWELLRITHCVEKIGVDISETLPDLIISDIILDDVSVFTFFNEKNESRIPLIFMTSWPQENHYESVKKLKNAALMVKPFHFFTLKSTVDLLLVHHKRDQKTSNHGIWVKGKQNLKVWVEEEKILWVHSNGNYCFIQTENAKYSVKSALVHLADGLINPFIQTHRAYLVNVRHIQKVELTRYQLYVNKQALPISRKYKEQVINYLYAKN